MSKPKKPVKKTAKPVPTLRKSGVGVTVQYCGHDATFLADIIEVGGACVVVAAEPIIDNKGLKRPARGATHLMVDFPVGGYWKPQKGIFVVPNEQIRLLEPGE